MEEIPDRINHALEKEEVRAERFANTARLIILLILTSVLLFNVGTLSVEATIMNASALLIGYCYGLIVFIRIREFGYHPLMKYITSCLDILLVFILLFLYTTIEIPSVALKNYIFYAVFPLIALTAFRYDRNLTLTAGGFAIALYVGMIFYLHLAKGIIFTNGGYERELFSPEVTYVGQLTKILILVGYVTLVSYLARYSRGLLFRLVSDESNLRHQKELTDWELTVASEVQAKLLPHQFPAMEGLDVYAAVQQGRFVGGDYCDFIKLNDNVVLMVTADVSGKGVPAALIMAEVRASTQLLAPMNLELENLTERINTLLYRSTTKKDFVTFFIAEINTLRKGITYVNAGHPPPLISTGGDIRSLSQRTIPLGLHASLPQLHRTEVKFPPGSILVSYTDGLLEQTDLHGEQYGEERLIRYVQTQAHLDVQTFALQLLDEVRNFGQGKELHDDVGVGIAKFSVSSRS